MGRKRRVFLTGATGNWGRCVLREFADRADRFQVVALVLPTRRDRRVIAGYADMPNLEVVYGDLTDYAAVESCVRGADYVLHVGALVSPAADDHPELAWRVNVGSAENIVRAVLAQPDPGVVAVVGVGSVAETGNRPPPVHWGRVGDPLRVSRYDTYGQSKVAAERVVVDSGLPRWTWLRQTAIFHPGVLEIRDAIMTHVPLGGVMEWVSAADAARLLANLCEDETPAEIWGGIYNIGGGAGWRLTNWEFQTRLMAALGVRDVRRWYDRNWFATGNFHGQWYTDSDRLDELIPFRQDTFDGALARAVRAVPPAVRLAGKVPPALVRHFVIKPLAHQPRGTMAFIRDNDEAKVSAYFGSRAEWESIGDWSTFTAPQPDPAPRLLDHGYDESADPARWTRDDLAGAASFRGGILLTGEPRPGDIATPLRWRCAEGHEFTGSPRLILTAGHWCPECVKDTARYPDQAAASKFLAQVVGAHPDGRMAAPGRERRKPT